MSAIENNLMSSKSIGLRSYVRLLEAVVKVLYDHVTRCLNALSAGLRLVKIPFHINRRPSPSSSPCQGEADASAPGGGLLEQSPGDFEEIKKIIDSYSSDPRESKNDTEESPVITNGIVAADRPSIPGLWT